MNEWFKIATILSFWSFIRWKSTICTQNFFLVFEKSIFALTLATLLKLGFAVLIFLHIFLHAIIIIFHHVLVIYIVISFFHFHHILTFFPSRFHNIFLSIRYHDIFLSVWSHDVFLSMIPCFFFSYWRQPHTWLTEHKILCDEARIAKNRSIACITSFPINNANWMNKFFEFFSFLLKYITLFQEILTTFTKQKFNTFGLDKFIGSWG